VFSVRPWVTIRNAMNWCRLRLLNPQYRWLCRNCDSVAHTTVNDGAHRFRFRHYYIQPEYQLVQIESCGFGNVRIYSSTTGAEIDRSELPHARDPWLYYLCDAVAV
jgi:hypothetical protein